MKKVNFIILLLLLQIGTQQDGSEINGFMNYYVYQLVF